MSIPKSRQAATYIAETMQRSHSSVLFFTFLLGLVSGLLIGGIVGDVCEKETGEYYYEIKVDENTKFLDFFDKYEIIEEKSRNIYC